MAQVEILSVDHQAQVDLHFQVAIVEHHLELPLVEDQAAVALLEAIVEHLLELPLVED